MKVGIVGWRGMVGSVLLDRMKAEGDFALIDPIFFSTSQAGQSAPDVGQGAAVLRDGNDLAALGEMDAIITCQGSSEPHAGSDLPAAPRPATIKPPTRRARRSGCG